MPYLNYQLVSSQIISWKAAFKINSYKIAKKNKKEKAIPQSNIGNSLQPIVT